MRIRWIDTENEGMPFDHDGKHATGREVYMESTDGWAVEYEGDYTCAFDTTEPDNTGYSDIVTEWLHFGGALYLDANATGNHETVVCTTDDDGVMNDLYECRSAEFADYGLEDYLKVLARKALESMGYEEAFITEVFANW